MANLKPLVTKTGKLRQLPSGDVLIPNPQAMTLVYVSNKLSTLTTANGVKSFFYSGNKLIRIEDSANGLSTNFFYTGNNLTSTTITVT